jgi:membrane-associated phospholipid phosphatase
MGSSQAEISFDEKRSYLVFGIIGFLSIPVLFYFDTPIWRAARDLVEPDYLYIPELFTHYGLYFFYFVFAVYGGYAYITKDRKRLKFCLAYIKAQLFFSLVIVQVLKTVLGRSRPGYGSDFNFFETSFKYNAFPSGHSADAFVSGLFLFFLLKHSKYDRYRFLPLIYASIIAGSRVFVSSHYPSDIAAGMAIGILGAWFFISRLEK